MENSRIILKPKTRLAIHEFIFIVICNVTLMYAYYFFTWWGLGAFLQPGIFSNYLDTWFIHLEIILEGILFGLMFGIINFFVDIAIFRRRSFGAHILIKTLLYIIAIVISGMSVYIFFRISNIVPSEMMDSVTFDHLPFSYLISFSVYLIFSILAINFLLQINRKFGYGVLFYMISGKYHKPRKEHRIFMFLDMKNSTGNVERLGHYDYSRLLQSCIHDLTDIIIRYKAQVYQYVGDEVVLTWPSTKGAKHLNCINLYYAYEQRLRDKKVYYQKHYGTIPEFKAGLAEGSVTVTEVGDMKREIAYHGEVVFTAARLEKMCNKLEKKVLINENLFSLLQSDVGFQYKEMGEFILKGKKQKEKIFGVNRIA